MSSTISPLPSQSPKVNRSRVTFVLHDAGETRALEPVMQQLSRQNIPYHILADGTADRLLKQNPELASHQSALPQEISQAMPDRQARMQNLMDALSSPTVVTGMVSNFQSQWANYFHKTGRQVLGYFDAFSVNTSGAHPELYSFKSSLNQVMAPSLEAAAELRQVLPNTPVQAVGQPALETMELEQANPSINTNTALLAQQLGVNPQQPILLFVGGYGEAYEAALRLFCQGLQASASQAQVLLAPHPKTDGALEQRVLAETGLTQRVKIVPSSIHTEALLPLASSVYTQNSTLSVPAVAQGKPVVLLGPSTTQNDPLPQHHLAERVIEPARLATILQAANQAPVSHVNPFQLKMAQSNLHQQLGIPTGANETILRQIGLG